MENVNCPTCGSKDVSATEDAADTAGSIEYQCNACDNTFVGSWGGSSMGEPPVCIRQMQVQILSIPLAAMLATEQRGLALG